MKSGVILSVIHRSRKRNRHCPYSDNYFGENSSIQWPHKIPILIVWLAILFAFRWRFLLKRFTHYILNSTFIFNSNAFWGFLNRFLGIKMLKLWPNGPTGRQGCLGSTPLWPNWGKKVGFITWLGKNSICSLPFSTKLCVLS